MKTDASLKYAFNHLRDSLKRMTRDTRASITGASPLELLEVNRRLDMVWKLVEDGQTFYRNIEFNAQGREVVGRSTLYNLLASTQLKAPVLTTIIQVVPPRLKSREVYEVKVGRRVVNLAEERYRGLVLQHVERTLHFVEPRTGQVRVHRCGVQAPVSEQCLDHAQRSRFACCSSVVSSGSEPAGSRYGRP